MKKVLLYLGNQVFDYNDVISFLNEENILYTIVSDENKEDIIGDLLITNETNIKISSLFPINFILFAGMNKDEVFAIIQKMQNLNISFSHKAMLTENNIKWNLQALLEEMEEEHAFMLTYNKTHALLKEANSLSYEDYVEETFIPYRDAFLKAYMYIKQNKPDKDTLDELNTNIIKNRDQLKKK